MIRLPTQKANELDENNNTNCHKKNLDENNKSQPCPRKNQAKSFDNRYKRLVPLSISQEKTPERSLLRMLPPNAVGCAKASHGSPGQLSPVFPIYKPIRTIFSGTQNCLDENNNTDCCDETDENCPGKGLDENNNKPNA